jgi:hypothetical protein
MTEKPKPRTPWWAWGLGLVMFAPFWIGLLMLAGLAGIAFVKLALLFLGPIGCVFMAALAWEYWFDPP